MRTATTTPSARTLTATRSSNGGRRRSRSGWHRRSFPASPPTARGPTAASPPSPSTRRPRRAGTTRNRPGRPTTKPGGWLPRPPSPAPTPRQGAPRPARQRRRPRPRASPRPRSLRSRRGRSARSSSRGRRRRRSRGSLRPASAPPATVSAGRRCAGSRLRRPDRQDGGSVTPASRPAQAKTFTLVSPAKVKIEASSESGSRKAALLLDGSLGTFWSRDPTDQFATLSFSFAEPVQLGRIAIAAGAAGAEFKLRHRPKALELTFSDGSTLTKTLTDQPQPQNIDFPPRSVARVTMKIAAVFQAPSTGSNYRRTSISEVRFFSAA